MNDREQILGKVNAALAPLKERAALPQYDDGLAAMRKLIAGRDLGELLAERMQNVNGELFTEAAALAARLKAGNWLHGYCDPALWPALSGAFGPEFQVETTMDVSRVDDYAFGITRAVGAIAETGTLILTDQGTTRRLAALAPWVHVAILKKSDIFADVHQAVVSLGQDPNTIWCTGPSKTADVEGILIQGVHGPGAQFALLT